MTNKQCEICSNLYTSNIHNSKFCSDECKRVGRNIRVKRNTQIQYEMIKCAQCNIEFKQVSKKKL